VPEPIAPLPSILRPAAVSAFGAWLPKAEVYAELLAGDGVVRGLIGPREVDRIWDRHILNCVAMAPLIDDRQYVVDVGSGAGLPGLVLALARPDITMVLVDSLARRTAFLEESVGTLGLEDRVSVVWARAEDVGERPTMFHVKPADVVTARAVAPLDRLAGWCLPLAAVGGRLLAMKGSSAADEIAEHAGAISQLGGGAPRIRECELDGVQPTVVVEIIREREVPTRSATRQRSASRSRRG
jgi:16S rRNA (guanine527-N7)-methyltransferase